MPDAGISTCKQLTDAYLVALARRHKCKLATLDRALAAMHSPGTTLVE
jgi:predicted nucleic acid-binding protein